MKVSDFDYDLPEHLIAQTPIEKRDKSRLMVLNRKEKTIQHKTFTDIIDYLNPGDCLVINNTKVIPARLLREKNNRCKYRILTPKRTRKRHLGNNSKTRKQTKTRNKSNIWKPEY